MSIEDCRNEIDAIDCELLKLLNLRAGIAIKVGILKRAAALPLDDLEREQDVLDHVRKVNSGPLDGATVTKLFCCIIRESRKTQENTLEARTAAQLEEMSVKERPS